MLWQASIDNLTLASRRRSPKLDVGWKQGSASRHLDLTDVPAKRMDFDSLNCKSESERKGRRVLYTYESTRERNNRSSEEWSKNIRNPTPEEVSDPDTAPPPVRQEDEMNVNVERSGTGRMQEPYVNIIARVLKFLSSISCEKDSTSGFPFPSSLPLFPHNHPNPRQINQRPTYAPSPNSAGLPLPLPRPATTPPTPTLVGAPPPAPTLAPTVGPASSVCWGVVGVVDELDVEPVVVEAEPDVEVEVDADVVLGVIIPDPPDNNAPTEAGVGVATCILDPRGDETGDRRSGDLAPGIALFPAAPPTARPPENPRDDEDEEGEGLGDQGRYLHSAGPAPMLTWGLALFAFALILESAPEPELDPDGEECKSERTGE
ncbi:hypothetical protein GALMADRAFT_132671 [Galerina marginata CBS 339.88]|uniref:Uncharacterized protein n=1 Tax=Galerina marginata (strain CBS 339.88) TaxID=685588 RepID=A0A067U3Q4_GALM3|nr:hypothetical protein GALMADRAFT_132671 [Galerina marginata CBS 339.88]